MTATTTVAPPPTLAGMNFLANRWIQLVLGIICMMAISSPQYVWALFTKPLLGKLGTDPSAPMFEAPGVKVPLTGYAFAERPVAGQGVELGIRPEHVLHGDGDIAADVEMVEPMGSDKLAWLRIGEQPLSIRLPAETPVARGDRLHLKLPAHRLNLFDAASGQRL